MSEFTSREEAEAYLQRRLRAVAESDLGGPLKPGIKGSVTRRTMLAEKLSETRLEMIDKCIRRECGFDHDDGSATPCIGGCGRTLHVVCCAQLPKGYAALGNFTCVECRGVKMMQEGQAMTEELERTLKRTMVLELSQGQESTAAAYAAFTALEERYAMGMGMALGSGMKMPRHNEEAFVNFISWFCTDAERARSLDSMVRSAGALMVKVGLPNLTTSGRVKAHLKEMGKMCSEESEPSTAATSRMMAEITRDGGSIDTRYSSQLLRAREKVQIEAEGVGGCRIGEVAGGGDSHGLLANETAILYDPVTEKEVVEAKLEHSKTGFSRYLDYAGMTEVSKVECAKHMKELWRFSGMKTTVSEQAGIQVTRPDYWVLRISLLGMTRPTFEKMLIYLKKVPFMLREVKSVEGKARGRLNQDLEEKKYFNILGGARDWPQREAACADLNARGYVAHIVPGPLLCATIGGSAARPTAMPLSTTSAYAPTKELLVMAHNKVHRPQEGNPDPELDVEVGRPAKWTTHSLRRLANTKARRHRGETNTTEAEIDLYFGWHEKLLLKEMQRHYEAMDIRERMDKAKITKMV